MSSVSATLFVASAKTSVKSHFSSPPTINYTDCICATAYCSPELHDEQRWVWVLNGICLRENNNFLVFQCNTGAALSMVASFTVQVQWNTNWMAWLSHRRWERWIKCPVRANTHWLPQSYCCCIVRKSSQPIPRQSRPVILLVNDYFSVF